MRYARHNLDIDEVKAHLTGGKMQMCVALTWKERLSFTLTDTMQIKGIKFLDVVFDGRNKPAKDEAFDVDAAMATGELSQLIPDLITALGGELDFIGQSAEIAAQHAPAAHVEGDGLDPRYDEAVAIVLEHKHASISTVQRSLQIGYNRAARLLDRMEKEGIVSAMDTSGARSILKAAATCAS